MKRERIYCAVCKKSCAGLKPTLGDGSILFPYHHISALDGFTKPCPGELIPGLFDLVDITPNGIFEINTKDDREIGKRVIELSPKRFGKTTRTMEELTKIINTQAQEIERLEGEIRELRWALAVCQAEAQDGLSGQGDWQVIISTCERILEGKDDHAQE